MASFLLFVQRVSQAYRPVSSLAMDRMYSKFVLLFLAVTFCDSSAQKVTISIKNSFLTCVAVNRDLCTLVHSGERV